MIKDVSIEVIQKCLNRCIHCSSCSTEDSVAMLDLNTMRRVIRGLQALKVERVCLSGGEPFLHPDLAEIVRQITDCGMMVDIYSCGVRKKAGTSEPLPVERLSAMKDAGLRSLLFNVQSVDELTYEYLVLGTPQNQGIFKTTTRKNIISKLSHYAEGRPIRKIGRPFCAAQIQTRKNYRQSFDVKFVHTAGIGGPAVGRPAMACKGGPQQTPAILPEKPKCRVVTSRQNVPKQSLSPRIIIGALVVYPPSPPTTGHSREWAVKGA